MKNKTNKPTNLFKIIFFFLVISTLLFNCEKENELVIQEQIEAYQPTINYLSGNDIPKLVNTITSKVGGKVSAKNKGGDITINTSFGEITFDNVMQVIDSIGNTNYTFKVSPRIPNDKVFYNLVINENFNEPFIFEYLMSDDFYAGYKNKVFTLQQFSGSIKKYRLTNLKSANKTLGKGDFENCPKVVMIDNGNTSPIYGSGGSGPTSGGVSGGGSPSGGGIDAGGGGTGGGVSYPTIPCRLVVKYNLCSSGGGGGHAPACQHAGGIHDQPENNEPCNRRCNGSTFDTAYLTGDCGKDDASDTHTSNRSASNCPDFDGDIGVIIPSEVEVLLRKLRIDLDLNHQQNGFLKQNPDLGVELYYFLEVNGWSLKAKNFALGQIELEVLTQNIPWVASSGEIAGSKFSHVYHGAHRSYYKLLDGSLIVASSYPQKLTSSGELTEKYRDNSNIPSNERYYYIKLPGEKWAEMLFNKDNLGDSLKNLFVLAGKDLGKNLGRYVLPIEDIKIMIDGKDFDGQEASRLKAAGFLLIAIVPGSKALKIVSKASDALFVAVKLGGSTLVIDTVKTGLRVVTDNNIIKFISQTGNEIARIANGIMTFKYTGFGGDIITNANKTTTILGRYVDNIGKGTKSILDSKLFKFGENKGGFNLLNENTWGNLTQNQKDLLNYNWLEQAFKRGDDIRLVSDQTNKFSNGILTQYGKELNWIDKFINTYNYSYNSVTKTFIKN